MADEPLLSPHDAAQLETSEAVARYLDAAVTRVSDTMTQRPAPPTDALTSMAYLEWERRCMVEHGRAIGAIESLQTFRLASRAQAEAARERLLWAVSLRVAQVSLGV